MKTRVDNKLDRIADIWNYFIWKYKYCSSKIKFNEDVKTNYFGDILGYFKDTLEIVFTKPKNTNYADKFSFTISFLQAIYVQQDFIQEMLEIFKTGINKGELKKDPTYYVNRDLRNELVGHPIRKFEDNLISSTLFSYQADDGEIQYLRYHKDNNFKFESKTFKIQEIQERHFDFLEKYFDKMLSKLKSILEDYLLELNKLENVINRHDFETVLKVAEVYFEDIFKSDFVYDKLSLSKIYDRRNEHMRYQNFIEKFYNDLRSSIKDKRNLFKNIFEDKIIEKESVSDLSTAKIEIVFVNSADIDEEIKRPRRVTYHYEIGKIATRRNSLDFNFFGGMLKSKCQNNNLVLSELEHMENNITDEIEYFTSLGLIISELKED